jgi:hypothetical protein
LCGAAEQENKMARRSKIKKTRMADALSVEIPPAAPPQPLSKLDTLIALMTRPGGALMVELCLATGWQAHSVRGAIAGTVKKVRGHTVASDSVDGARRYSIVDVR